VSRSALGYVFANSAFAVPPAWSRLAKQAGAAITVFAIAQSARCRPHGTALAQVRLENVVLMPMTSADD